jgi:hypothetical protein
MTPITIRLPGNLHALCKEFGDTVGLSLNALVIASLVEYLNLRPGSPGSGAPTRSGMGMEGDTGVKGRFGGVEAASPRPKEEKSIQGVARNSPCPCGSGKKYKRCHGVVLHSLPP